MKSIMLLVGCESKDFTGLPKGCKFTTKTAELKETINKEKNVTVYVGLGIDNEAAKKVISNLINSNVNPKLVFADRYGNEGILGEGYSAFTEYWVDLNSKTQSRVAVVETTSQEQQSELLETGITEAATKFSISLNYNVPDGLSHELVHRLIPSSDMVRRILFDGHRRLESEAAQLKLMAAEEAAKAKKSKPTKKDNKSKTDEFKIPVKTHGVVDQSRQVYNKLETSDAVQNAVASQKQKNKTVGKRVRGQDALGEISDEMLVVPVEESPSDNLVPVVELPPKEKARSSGGKSLVNLMRRGKSGLTITNDGSMVMPTIKPETILETAPTDIEIDTSRYQTKRYSSTMDYFIAEGIITKEDVTKIRNERDSLRSQKGIQYTLEDVIIMLGKADEETVTRAMIQIHNIEFLTSKRLREMKILTDFYPKDICKKYLFLHTEENPRVLIATYGNSLPANLGPNFGNARIRYALPSVILGRLDAEGSWIKNAVGNTDKK